MFVWKKKLFGYRLKSLRANAELPFMGLAVFEGDKPTKSEL